MILQSSLFEKMRFLKNRIKFYLTVNWIKTLYFNFKKFPFSIARKLPVYFYGKVRFNNISGGIVIEAPIRSGMIGFGQSYEIMKSSKGIAEITLVGKIILKGHVQFGKDYFVFVGVNAVLEMGNMSSLGSGGKIICYEKIILGNYARIGYESQLSDTNAHKMINTKTGEVYSITSPILIGNYNYISNRVSILSKTITPNYCTIASNSLCNKDYTHYGENVLIGGIPAKLLKNDISRDWKREHEDMERWLKI